MANIPGKQLHRTGTTAELKAYLSNGEFGYSTEEKRAYTKIAGELVPLADSKFVLFGATFTPSSGTYQWPDAAAVASAVAGGKDVAIDLATQGNVVRYYLHYTNGSGIYIFESTSFSRITLNNGEYTLQKMIDTELKSDSSNPVSNSALTAIIGNVEAALAGL
jgi:hypothetical protein